MYNGCDAIHLVDVLMQNLEYGVVNGSEVLTEGSSAKCYSVWKPNANLLDTLVALSSAFKYFQMLPAPP
jgi:hypothetical protein